MPCKPFAVPTMLASVVKHQHFCRIFLRVCGDENWTDFLRCSPWRRVREPVNRRQIVCASLVVFTYLQNNIYVFIFVTRSISVSTWWAMAKADEPPRRKIWNRSARAQVKARHQNRRNATRCYVKSRPTISSSSAWFRNSSADFRSSFRCTRWPKRCSWESWRNRRMRSWRSFKRCSAWTRLVVDSRTRGCADEWTLST